MNENVVGRTKVNSSKICIEFQFTIKITKRPKIRTRTSVL